MKNFIVAFALIAGTTAPAFAWGDREQGMLTGAAATLLAQHAVEEYRDSRRDSRSSNVQDRDYDRPVRRRPAGITVVPPRNGAAEMPPIRIPQYECSTEDLYNSYGEYVTSRQICQ